MNSRNSIGLALLLTLLAAPRGAAAQGTRADYQRADGLRGRFRDKVFKAKVEPHWFDENTKFWYRNLLPEGREFVVVDAAAGIRRPAFDHKKLAAALSEASGRGFQADRLPFDWLDFSRPGVIRFKAEGKAWDYHPETNAVTTAEDAGRDQTRSRRPRRRGRNAPRPRAQSPDGRWTAFIRGHNVWLRGREDDDEQALTTDGVEEDAYEPRFFWSPDSTKLAALRTRRGDERLVYLIESAPKDQLQPKLHSYSYRKPGDRIPLTRPHMFDIASGKEICFSNSLFANPWSVSEMRWWPGSRRFTFLYNQRGHQALRIVALNADTATAEAVVDEQSETFIDYAYKQFSHYLDDTGEIIWMSERDGWNHLYLYDAASGAVKNQITRGPWVVRGVERVDEERRQIWIRVAGIYPQQDPYYVHYARVNFDGGGLTLLTDGDGDHEIQYSPDRRFLLDTYSRVDRPPVTELRKADDGAKVCELEQADASAPARLVGAPPNRSWPKAATARPISTA